MHRNDVKVLAKNSGFNYKLEKMEHKDFLRNQQEEAKVDEQQELKISYERKRLSQMPNLQGDGMIDTIKLVQGRFSPEASRVQLFDSDDEEERNQISIDVLKAKRLEAENYAIQSTAYVAAEIKRRESVKSSEQKSKITKEASKAKSILSKYTNI